MVLRSTLIIHGQIMMIHAECMVELILKDMGTRDIEADMKTIIEADMEMIIETDMEMIIETDMEMIIENYDDLAMILIGVVIIQMTIIEQKDLEIITSLHGREMISLTGILGELDKVRGIDMIVLKEEDMMV